MSSSYHDKNDRRISISTYERVLRDSNKHSVLDGMIVSLAEWAMESCNGSSPSHVRPTTEPLCECDALSKHPLNSNALRAWQSLAYDLEARLERACDAAAEEHGRAAEMAASIRSGSAPSATVAPLFTLRWLQENLPWTLPYSEHFEATAYPLDRVKHDVLHVMKSLGRIAAECENHDHGRDRKLYGPALAKEVADFVICALHIAKLEGFDLEDAVIDNSSLRNGVNLRRADGGAK